MTVAANERLRATTAIRWQKFILKISFLECVDRHPIKNSAFAAFFCSFQRIEMQLFIAHPTATRQINVNRW